MSVRSGKKIYGLNSVYLPLSCAEITEPIQSSRVIVEIPGDLLCEHVCLLLANIARHCGGSTQNTTYRLSPAGGLEDVNRTIVSRSCLQNYLAEALEMRSHPPREAHPLQTPELDCPGRPSDRQPCLREECQDQYFRRTSGNDLPIGFEPAACHTGKAEAFITSKISASVE